jgi:hypothetical protein
VTFTSFYLSNLLLSSFYHLSHFVFNNLLFCLFLVCRFDLSFFFLFQPRNESTAIAKRTFLKSKRKCWDILEGRTETCYLLLKNRKILIFKFWRKKFKKILKQTKSQFMMIIFLDKPLTIVAKKYVLDHYSKIRLKTSKNRNEVIERWLSLWRTRQHFFKFGFWTNRKSVENTVMLSIILIIFRRFHFSL